MVVRAFADDIGLVVANLSEALPVLEHIFKDLQDIAELSLNMPRCVLIPLWRVDPDTLRQDLQLQCSFWAATSIQGSGKYLGFHIGPLAGSMSWEAPLQKYLKAAKEWGALGLGLHLSTLAYGIYILPVLSFVAQLSNPPDKAWEIERKALSLMVPGGYKWILPEDLFRLKANFGQAASFPSLKMLVQAAQKRVQVFENSCFGGLRLEEKSREMGAALQQHLNGRYVAWQGWFSNSPVQILRTNALQLDQLGLTTGVLMNEACGPVREGESAGDNAARAKKIFQCTVRKRLFAMVSWGKVPGSHIICIFRKHGPKHRLPTVTKTQYVYVADVLSQIRQP